MSPADRNHRPGWRDEPRLVDAVSLFFLRDDRQDFVADFAVGGAAAQQVAEVVVFLAEEAGAQFSVGGHAQARARAAERLRDGIDQSNYAAAGGEAIFAGRFAAIVHDRDQRPFRRNPRINFRARDYFVADPLVVGVQRHEFDEAHDQAAVAREGREILDFAVI